MNLRCRSHPNTIPFVCLLAVAIADPASLAFAAITGVDGPDDICPADADPCVIKERVVIDSGNLDFGSRTVRLEGQGGFNVGSWLNLKCGRFDSSSTFGATVNSTDPVDGAGIQIEVRGRCELRDEACSFDQQCDFGVCDEQTVCDGDLSVECRGDTDCDLGACSPRLCSRDGATVCGDDADCSFGSCNLSLRRCAEDPSRPCFNNTQCNLGPCSIKACSGRTTTFCETEVDCHVGTCSALTCSAGPERRCSSDADCFFGTCEFADSAVVIGGEVNLSASQTGGTLSVSASSDVRIDGPLRARTNTGEGIGGNFHVSSNRGSVIVTAPVIARGYSEGGTVCIDAAENVLLGDLVDVQGGDYDGGYIDVYADRRIDVLENLVADSLAGGGSGGEIRLDAGENVELWPEAKISARATTGDEYGEGGSGGIIELNSSGTARLRSRSIVTTGGAGRGEGAGSAGSIYVSGVGDVHLFGLLHAEGGGLHGFNEGSIHVDTENEGRVFVGRTGRLRVDNVTNAYIFILADGAARIRGRMDIRAGNSSDTSVMSVESEKDVNLRGRLRVTTTADEESGLHGKINLEGENVTLAKRARIFQRGYDARNRVAAKCHLTIGPHTRISIRDLSGQNYLSYDDDHCTSMLEGVIGPMPIVNGY